jgi:formate dehydrogenase maturation protein FdhE
MTSPSTILDKVPDEQEGHKAEYVKAYVVPGIHGVSRLETIPLEQMTHFSEQNNCPACGCLPDWLDLISLGGTTASNGNRLACCRQCSHVT